MKRMAIGLLLGLSACLANTPNEARPGPLKPPAAVEDGTIPVRRDGRHKDAHDKVVLIDGHTLITGSFNFTDQSDEVNAENLLIIRDKPMLYAAYEANFERHRQHSEHIESR